MLPILQQIIRWVEVLVDLDRGALLKDVQMKLIALLFGREPPIKHREGLFCNDALEGLSLVLYKTLYLGELIYALRTILTQTSVPYALLNACTKGQIIGEPCPVICSEISGRLSPLMSGHYASWRAHLIGSANVSALCSETHFHNVISGVFK